MKRNETKRNKTKRNKAKQNKTKQNKTKHIYILIKLALFFSKKYLTVIQIKDY